MKIVHFADLIKLTLTSSLLALSDARSLFVSRPELLVYGARVRIAEDRRVVSGCSVVVVDARVRPRTRFTTTTFSFLPFPLVFGCLIQISWNKFNKFKIKITTCCYHFIAKYRAQQTSEKRREKSYLTESSDAAGASVVV